MSPSTSKSGPITLRRACQACSRGKRRCDQRLPRCSRCQKLRLDCEYVNLPLSTDLGQGPGSIPLRPPLQLEIIKGYEASIIAFLVEGISSLPLSFAQKMKTHFIHPELWSCSSVPPPIRDMHALCKLYTKTPFNNSTHLVPSLRHQINSYQKRVAKATNFEDLLASAQALLLTHCMLIASENPSAPFSESTSAALLALGENLYNQAPIQLPHTLSPRRAWLFAESVRRTIIVGFMLRSVYSLKTRNYSVRTPFVDSLPFDMRTGLWDFSCGEGLAGGNEIGGDAIVSLHRYSGLLESGRVHGIGAFGGLVLAACRGKDVSQVLYPALA
ncbi:Zn(II)2Cys6 transcription factor domain-containing protein [Aspergillus stella-maris]|uniref:Zn(II)2Cys6 transcription factor domain-containing protein n=1 Tax=Aspergillus stella-maris TaxID=1810926 RepID=UPI003CCCB7A9